MELVHLSSCLCIWSNEQGDALVRYKSDYQRAKSRDADAFPDDVLDAKHVVTRSGFAQERLFFVLIFCNYVAATTYLPTLENKASLLNQSVYIG